MSKPLDRMTKAELLGVIASKDAELAVLRAKCSELSAPQATHRPSWLAEHEARRAAIAESKAEALRTGRSTKVSFR